MNDKTKGQLFFGAVFDITSDAWFFMVLAGAFGYPISYGITLLIIALMAVVDGVLLAICGEL